MRITMMVLAAAMVSFAGASAAGAAEDGQDAAPKKEKKICRRYEVTGSIVATRSECHTAAEWAAMDKKNSSEADDALKTARRPSISRNSGF